MEGVQQDESSTRTKSHGATATARCPRGERLKEGFRTCQLSLWRRLPCTTHCVSRTSDGGRPRPRLRGESHADLAPDVAKVVRGKRITLGLCVSRGRRPGYGESGGRGETASSGFGDGTFILIGSSYPSTTVSMPLLPDDVVVEKGERS